VKWNRAKGRKDRNVIDARGSSPPSGGGSSGGLGGLPIPGNIAGLGGGAGIVVLIVIVAIQVFGGGSSGGFDLGPVFGADVQAPGTANPVGIPAEEDS
jgi:predicted metalloprotease